MTEALRLIHQQWYKVGRRIAEAIPHIGELTRLEESSKLTTPRPKPLHPIHKTHHDKVHHGKINHDETNHNKTHHGKTHHDKTHRTSCRLGPESHSPLAEAKKLKGTARTNNILRMIIEYNVTPSTLLFIYMAHA
ncbi:hypothetical protein TWF481_007007 [Arthrobotrys musiformis]|uniref:Uncharacterized protein n=1 Tax=Arthrobotrys musiformis TaxID=47236 RepID=A0AAV9WB57_9PEZI